MPKLCADHNRQKLDVVNPEMPVQISTVADMALASSLNLKVPLIVSTISRKRRAKSRKPVITASNRNVTSAPSSCIIPYHTHRVKVWICLERSQSCCARLRGTLSLLCPTLLPAYTARKVHARTRVPMQGSSTGCTVETKLSLKQAGMDDEQPTRPSQALLLPALHSLPTDRALLPA